MPRKKNPNPAPPELGGTFDPLVLDKTVIAIPLLDKIRQETMAGAARTIYKVIIDLNLEYPTGREGARDWVIANVAKAKEVIEQKYGLAPETQDVDQSKSSQTNQYLFASLEGRVIQELVRLDEQEARGPATNSRFRAGTERQFTAKYILSSDLPNLARFRK